MDALACLGEPLAVSWPCEFGFCFLNHFSTCHANCYRETRWLGMHKQAGPRAGNHQRHIRTINASPLFWVAVRHAVLLACVCGLASLFMCASLGFLLCFCSLPLALPPRLYCACEYMEQPGKAETQGYIAPTLHFTILVCQGALRLRTTLLSQPSPAHPNK